MLIVIMTASVGFLIFNQITLGNKRQQESEVESRINRLLLSASVRILSSRANLMRFISDNTSSIDAATVDIDQAVTLLSDAKSINLQADQDGAISNVINRLTEYKSLILQIQTSRLNDQGTPNTALLFDAYNLEDDLEQKIEAITAASQARVDSINAAAITDTQRKLSYLSIGYVFTLLLSVFIVIYVQRSITRPINELRTGAESFRSGNMDASIAVEGTDELSELAVTFNQMGMQLSKSYHNLGQRVAERTQELEERIIQLQVASEIAREAASVKDLDNLLNRAVNLIRDRFNLYFVSIFLIDDLGKFAVLQAATGEAGRAFKQREYKLKVGDVGIVSYVSNTGTPRIVNNVETDYVYRKEVLLPDTRSEMALPLKISGKVTGILDVQSNRIDAFSEDSLSSLQILADQLAVAIQNALLVSELETRLKEINTLYQRYTQESWSHAIPQDKPVGYEYDLSMLSPVKLELSSEVINDLKKGQIVTTKTEDTSDNKTKSRLISPLTMYDRVIGALGLEENDPNHEWSPDEITLIKAVTNQVALALDNARMLEETQRRTAQLRLLQEITSAAASHVKLEELLDNVSQKIRAGFDLLHCSIALFDINRETATIIADVSVNPFSPGSNIKGVKIPVEGSELTQRIIKTRKSSVVYDAQTNPLSASTHELLKLRGTNTLVVVPIIIHDEVIGTIGMDVADQNRLFKEEDLNMLDQVSIQIAASIEVALNFEHTSQRAEREKLVSEVTGRIRETLDVETVLKTAVNEIYRNFKLNEVSLYLIPADSESEKEANN
jgi:GAF domain-containing protein/HAMP domain-containing protein